MKILMLLPFMLMLMLCFNCSSDDDTLASNSTGDPSKWLIPSDEVFDGGPGKDGIPSVDSPQFELANADFIDDDDLVVGIVSENEARAYPHFILDWHEIVNDDIGDLSIAIVYCPLTGTALGWDRTVGDSHTTFGVSGLIYNNNIIPYDRATGSNWSQMRMECVNGQLIKTMPTTHQVVETTWATWKKLYPNTKIMSTDTGHSRNYGRYPYGSYKTGSNLLFPISESDDRLHAKERVHGVILENRAEIFRFSSFEQAAVIQHRSQDSDIIIVGSKKDNFMVSFVNRSINGERLTFHIPEELKVDSGFNSPILIEDQLGNQWDIFGHAVSGPNQGEQLVTTQSMMGYWFSFHAFYPNPVIYDFSGN